MGFEKAMRVVQIGISGKHLGRVALRSPRRRTLRLGWGTEKEEQEAAMPR